MEMCYSLCSSSLEAALRAGDSKGTEARAILGDAKSAEDLGADFGATVTARELDWAMANEWVRCADDFLWRRTKLGLKLNKKQAYQS